MGPYTLELLQLPPGWTSGYQAIEVQVSWPHLDWGAPVWLQRQILSWPDCYRHTLFLQELDCKAEGKEPLFRVSTELSRALATGDSLCLLYFTATAVYYNHTDKTCWIGKYPSTGPFFYHLTGQDHFKTVWVDRCTYKSTSWPFY